jgi:predicted nucleic acid-binding protein
MKKFVVNTSVIISALIKANKETIALFTQTDYLFFTPEEILKEIDKYKNLIAKKSGLNLVEIDFILSFIFTHINLISKENYSKFLDKALKITKEIDINDAPFVTVYFAVRVEGIISYDKDFDKMGLKRYTPRDLLKNKLSL